MEFRLASARIGGQELVLSSEAEVSRVGDKFLLNRGGVVVAYDVGLDQVEQSFSLSTAGAEGDLVLDLVVTTDLIPRRVGGGFSFDGDEGSVRYGSAIAFDTAGRRVSVPSELTATGLRVPASFVESVDGQLVVDPMISTFSVDGAVGDQTESDLVYDRISDAFVFVYEDKFSGVDRDVFWRATTPAGAVVSTGYVELGLEDWSQPSIANIGSNQSVIIVAKRDIGEPWDAIVGRIVAFSSQTIGPVLLIGDTGVSGLRSGNDRPMVAAGFGFITGGDAPVVWEREIFSGDVSPKIATASVGGRLDLAVEPWRLPLGPGTVPAMAGDRFQWQAWHRDSVSGAASANYSNAISLRF